MVVRLRGVVNERKVQHAVIPQEPVRLACRARCDIRAVRIDVVGGALVGVQDDVVQHFGNIADKARADLRQHGDDAVLFQREAVWHLPDQFVCRQRGSACGKRGVRGGGVLRAGEEVHISKLARHLERVGRHREGGDDWRDQCLQVHILPEFARLQSRHQFVTGARRSAVHRCARHRAQQLAAEALELSRVLGVHAKPAFEPPLRRRVRCLYVGGADARSEQALRFLGAVDPRGAEAFAPLRVRESAHQCKVEDVHAGVCARGHCGQRGFLRVAAEGIAPHAALALCGGVHTLLDALRLLAQQADFAADRLEPLSHERIDVCEVFLDCIYVGSCHCDSPFLDCLIFMACFS